MKTRFEHTEHLNSGLALILILLLGGLYFKQEWFFKTSVICILLIMIKPSLLYPFTFTWLNVSDYTGRVISKIILTLIYLLFVIPVGYFRKISGKDNLKLKQFKKSDESVFIQRDHTFTKQDMMNPF